MPTTGGALKKTTNDPSPRNNPTTQYFLIISSTYSKPVPLLDTPSASVAP